MAGYRLAPKAARARRRPIQRPRLGWLTTKRPSTTVAVGLATETSSAFAITEAATVVNVGLATDTSTAFATAYYRVVAVGQAVERCGADPIVPAGGSRVESGVPEAGLIWSFQPQTIITVGQAVETGSALHISHPITAAAGIATETNQALAITARKQQAVGQATETDSALQLTRVRLRPVGQVVETTVALAIINAGGITVIAVGQAVETSTAIALVAPPAFPYESSGTTRRHLASTGGPSATVSAGSTRHAASSTGGPTP